MSFLTKKTIHIATKSMYTSSRIISTASFSTAYERAEGSNAVAEANSDDGGVTMEGMYKGIKEEDRAMTSDPAREGPIKAEEEGDIVRDTAKDSMDGAWMAAQDAKHKAINRDDDDDKKRD
ncbi:uncharacterized protein LOC123895142 [Trifolium pratense]|uniref:uncharacterized protein LOC123895142 n=1 Tax=Trifolium pratense TaxID=57577 RepID=UPI001E6956EC|nr:uncharacterized protein LOC123895142 [Trifolium pratense]